MNSRPPSPSKGEGEFFYLLNILGKSSMIWYYEHEMPQLGEIRQGSVLGYKTLAKRIWHACEICGKERWVLFIKGKPKNRWCANCSRKMAAQLRRNYRGSQNPHWHGGVHYGDGYVFIWQPEHPRVDPHGYIKRAILVLEEKLGRPLLLGMDSHHINGIKDDDRPENLMELSKAQHMSLPRITSQRTTAS